MNAGFTTLCLLYLEAYAGIEGGTKLCNQIIIQFCLKERFYGYSKRNLHRFQQHFSLGKQSIELEKNNSGYYFGCTKQALLCPLNLNGLSSVYIHLSFSSK